MNILVIQLRQLGDILLTTPVIRALKSRDPSLKVDVMTYSMGRLIIPGNPLVHKHLIAPQKGVVDSLRFVRDLQKHSYDAVIDFMSTPRSALIARLARSEKRISFDSGRARLFTDVIPRDGASEYIVRQKFRLLAPLGIESNDIRLMLPWTEGDAGVAVMHLSEHRYLAESRRRVMLSPTHRRAERRWPMESWAKLATWLEKEQNASVIWAWGPGEEAEVSAIRLMANGAGTMAPRTTFRELAAFVASCDLFIANSNGPSHIAVAVNTPSIQLHGPTSAISWCPQTARHQAVQKATMAEIEFSEVASLVESMWPLVDRGASSLRGHGAITNADDVWVIRPEL